ncbi:DUF4932 domain-containing protein [Inconstantimicrobium mannanitabidum]|uniref:Uncharacterized protein n=1 Tax=Inconstantimicrobium mannanitabidum TaxID=1604901 RepID=A0ACB5RHD7_9CLOT|nr:DUF4932 domain-containing protein [Clostridium sp. TW13]GKX68521.1 hypothetical protein rsdtw13_37790 [Clostridium sp. TW13]
MKKRILLLGLISVLLFNFFGCGSSKKNNEVVDNKNIVIAIKQSGKCNVSIEPKIELLSIMQYIADDPAILKKDLYKDNEKYSKDISEYFSSYKNEGVVTLYKEMMKSGFNYSAPAEAMLYVDDNLKLINNLTLPEDVVNSAGGKEKLLKFYNLLDDFRKKTKFDDFYIKHNDFYKNLVSAVKTKVDQSECIETLEKYYGYKQNSYNFIIEPLSIGGYAARIPSKDGKFDLYDFMVVPNNNAEFFQLIIHEFGHSYVNPLTAQNINEINKYDNLFTSIKEVMTKQQYSSWEFCVNENIVRAVAYRTLFKNFGYEVSEGYINMDTQKKFIFIKAITENLKEYEDNRDKYPTFNDFYPKLVEMFKELSNKQVPK